MSTKDKTGLQIIATQSLRYRLLNAVCQFWMSFLASIFFMIAIFVIPLPVGDILYNISWIFAVFTVILVLLRNKILHFMLKKISHSNFLSLVYFGRKVSHILIVSGLTICVISFLIADARFFFFSSGILFTWIMLSMTFEKPLTQAGEIRLLFKLLHENLSNFEGRQKYLRLISKKVEKRLKMGNIKVPHNEFIYYCNMELFKGNLDIQNDLKNIEAWLVDSKTPCFESLKKIYPENKFEPFRRHSLFIEIAQSPAMKAIVYVIALIILATSPVLQNEIFVIISKLLGL